MADDAERLLKDAKMDECFFVRSNGGRGGQGFERGGEGKGRWGALEFLTTEGHR
jgi:hypothetical protein